MISSLRHKHSISWTFSNNSLVISAKKKCRRITLIKSVLRIRVVLHRDGGLNFTFPHANNGFLLPFLYQPPHSRSRRVSYLKVPNILNTRMKDYQITSITIASARLANWTDHRVSQVFQLYLFYKP